MKLSIIIPTYNNFKNLSRCLKSLEKQTVFKLFNVETILVDDGSDINTGSHRSDFASLIRTRDNIHTYHIKHAGAPAARNFGFAKSKGKYVFFCDADVVFLKKNALEKMIQLLEQTPNKAYCYSSFKFGWKKFKCGPFVADKLKQDNYISTMSLIRRSALEKILNDKNKPFDENLKKFQDWDLWLSLLDINQTGIYLPETLWQAKNKGLISKWFPKILYKFPAAKKIEQAKAEFKQAKEIILKKHNL